MTSETVEIRPSVDSDISQLQILERSAGELFRLVPGLEWISDDKVMSQASHRKAIADGLSYAASVRPSRREHFIHAGFICGVGSGSELHINELSVGTEWQDRGIGKRLVNDFINVARQSEFLGVTLTTFRDVPWNEPFYQKLGFQTLVEEALGERLSRILKEEELQGFVKAQRCGMRLSLR